MSVRQAIADAASTVEGVHAQPLYRSTTTAGQAFVRLDRVTYEPGGFGGVATWQLVVILPNDMAQAEAKAEDLRPALVDALGHVLLVTRAELQSINFPNLGALPSLVITGNREE